MPTKAYAAQSPTSALGPHTIERREPGPTDVQIEILYCGVCHSDLHTARDEWGGTVYPCVPGHEIVGRVTKVGAEVKKFREGDLAGVGCLVDSCRTCPSCREGLEQYCETGGMIFTYNGPDKQLGGVTYGGYSQRVVVTEDFVLKISEKVDLAATAPLLCAGITTYSPLRHWNVGPGQKVGVVGLGGLGHMAREIRPCLRRARRALHHLAGQSRGRPPLRRRRSRHLQGRRRDEEARKLLRLHPRCRLGQARPERLPRRS